MSNIIAGTLLGVLTGALIVWFFKKLIDSSIRNSN